LGDSEIEAILKRMDRLTQEEARMTTTQTLAVVHGLLNNVKVVMDGESSRLQFKHLIRLFSVEAARLQRVQSDGL
jgi:hypothetical protein